MAFYLGSQEKSVFAGQPLMIIPDGSITTEKIANEAVGTSKIAAGAVSTIYTASIPMWGVWVEDGEQIYNSVSVPGILATDNPIIDIALPTTAADAEKITEQWSCFIGATTEAGKVNFYVKEIPSHGIEDTIPVRILCIRK